MPPKQPPGPSPKPDRPLAPRNDHREAFQRGTTVSSAEDQMARTAALDEAVEALRIHFEQYFLGLVRKPPTQERAAIRTAILQLKSSFVRNTAVKFRVNALHNRFLSYERMWDRTIREIEEGTYRRDLFKARLHQARAEGQAPGNRTRPDARRAAEAEPPGGDRSAAAENGPDDFDVDEEAPGEGATPPVSARPAPATAGPVPPDAPATGWPPPPEATPTRPVAGPASPPAPASPGRGPRPAIPAPGPSRPAVPEPGASARQVLDDARVRAIHAAYVDARRRCQETTDGITVEAIGAALRKQVPELLARHQARSIDFRVVVKDGKAVLKAFPR